MADRNSESRTDLVFVEGKLGAAYGATDGGGAEIKFSVIMCGHLSKEQLDAVALACTLINVAALSIGLGLSTGCDTYFAQTFGSRHKKRVGLYLQRSLLVMYMFLVPVYCLHLNIKPVLLLLGQDPIISDMTARYILIFMPGVFFDYTFLVLARYLQTQNRVNPPLVCAVIGNVFNAVSQYIAIYVMGFEFEASAVCQAASLFVMCLCILVYIRVFRVFEETWDGWKTEALYDIGGFIRLAVPGLLLVSLENISFEVGTFLAGSLNAVQLAAQAILFQSISLLYMVCIGMSIAVNIRVGQHLGAGSIEKAKHTCKVAVTMILVTSTLICVFFATCREQVASIFTSDPEVKAATVELLAVYAPYPYFDGLSATAAGVLKGSGQQLIGAAVNIVAYDFISLPIGIPLSLLTPLQMKGFWIAMLLGIVLQSIVFWLIIWRTNWEKQAAAALSRASGQQIKKTPKRRRKNVSREDQTEPLLASEIKPSHVRSASRVYSTPYESEVELDLTQPPSLPPLRPVLIRRLATWLCLAVCLAAAIVLRLFQGVLVPLRDQSSRALYEAEPRSGLLGVADRFGAKFFPLGYWSEFREIAKLHLPAFLTCFFQFLLQTISVIMCGHLSKEQLDAVALACTLINVAALSIGLGLSTGCDTYFAQTFGSRHKKRVGLYLQRSLLVMYMFLVPVYCLHLNIKPVLLLLGQDPIISDMTARYILIFMPGVFFDYTFLVLARYLQTQNRVNPPLVCAVIGNVFNAVSQYIAIYVMGFEFEASAVCQAASLFVMCLCILVYIRVFRVFEDTWDGWKTEALYDIGGFIRLAVPGLLLVSLENISFEIGTLVAGNISLLQLAAQAIVFQTASLLYMHLGAGKVEQAIHTCKVAVTIIMVTSTVICVTYMTCKDPIASIFTSDPEVKAATTELMTIYAPFPFVDGLSATASGVLKGSGRQLIGAVVNIIAYDVIALPIGLPLSLLTGLEMKGFWIGV
uniref:Multidrug and toxin extrusion protein n=1 Tax=Macrostomum lignano TaxID=282301 RepID=A0A1I8IEY0_9PLAT